MDTLSEYIDPTVKCREIAIMMAGQPVYVWVPLSLNYQQAKNHIAGNLRDAAFKRFCVKRRKRPQPGDIKTPKVRFMKLACAALRKLKEEGVVFRMPSHSLEYFKAAPPNGNPSELEPFWSKDPVFRAACKHLMFRHQCLNWEEFKKQALDYQQAVVSGLTKPWRRDLATGRISFRVASNLRRFDGSLPNHDTTPRWAVSSTVTFNQWNWWHKADGMKHLTKNTLKELTKLHPDLLALVNIAKRRNIRTPRTLEGYRRFDRDAHDQTSALYNAIMNEHSGPDILMLEELPPMPELPDGPPDKVTILWRQEDLAAEGQEMGHCVGLYAGSVALIASVVRNEDRVTMMVGKYNSQCYGRFNQTTKLSSEINEIWIPFLQPIIDQTEPKLIQKPENVIEFDY